MAHPEELNLLTTVQFKMEIPSLPNMTYYLQSAILPSITLEGGILPGIKRDVPVPGHKLEFDTLTVTFLIDQDLRNYEEIYYWIVRIGGERFFKDMVSDLSIHFLTGIKNVSRTMNFIGAYPTALTEIAVNSDDNDSTPVVGTAIFQYQYFTFSQGNFPYKVE